MIGKTLPLGLFVVACCMPMTVISPEDMTRAAIGETFYRIHLYGRLHGRLPESLSVLADRGGYSNRTTDGWGRALNYSIGDDGLVSLTSLGQDGQAGGLGPDQDVTVTYRSRRPDGSMWVGEDLWIVEAENR